MAFVAQAGNSNYIDFLSAHMLFKLKLRGVVPIWGWSKASTPYLISGLVTRLSCILCRLVFVLFWCYLSLASVQSHLLILMFSVAALLLLFSCFPSGINWK